MKELEKSKKFLVVGSGGIGGYFGGRLAQHGYDVTFLARGDHYRSMKSDGLRVKSVIGDFRIQPTKVVDELSKAERPDVILFCVKTYDTVSVASMLRPLVDESSLILSIQNGINNDLVIGEQIEKGKIFPGLAHIISTKVAPGEISQTAGPRELIFGDRNNRPNPDLAELEKNMKAAEIDAKSSDTFEKDQWRKFIFIVSFAGMTSACKSSIGMILENPDAYAVYKKSVEEAITVARAHNVLIDDDIFEEVIKRTEAYRGPQSGAKSSMLKDIEAGRPTEIEALSGAIIKMGKERGVHTPVHETIRNAVLSGNTI